VSTNRTVDRLVGKTLQGRYRILKRIGKGGMGVVYLAEHVLIRRKVAIKVLHGGAFDSDELVLRFKREAMAAAAVGSEHVVGVTDMSELEDGSHYIVLEYLDGVDVAWAVDSDGPFAIGRAARVVSQLCDALTAVHEAGIVHRDLKPENVFLVERGATRDFVKVLDFGVCHYLDPASPEDGRLTATGAAVGTPQFMAPEQVEGRRDIGPAADIHGAGGLLYFALTGTPPFEDTSLPRLFMRISLEPPPPLRAVRADVPAELEAVVLKAMHKCPQERFATSAELKTALAPFLHMDGAVASMPAKVSCTAPTSIISAARGPSASSASIPGRRRVLPWLAVATLVPVLAALLLYGLSAGKDAVASPARKGRATEKPRGTFAVPLKQTDAVVEQRSETSGQSVAAPAIANTSKLGTGEHRAGHRERVALQRGTGARQERGDPERAADAAMPASASAAHAGPAVTAPSTIAASGAGVASSPPLQVSTAPSPQERSAVEHENEAAKGWPRLELQPVFE
jgi:eukaryotic-like serine/threonine-protein kinase